jgi:hypothetical protein
MEPEPELSCLSEPEPGSCRGVPRILPGGMHIFAWPTPPPPLDPLGIRIKTMRIHSPGLNCQKITV